MRRNSALTNVLVSVGAGGIVPHPRTVWFPRHRVSVDEETFAEPVPVLVVLPGDPRQEGDEVPIGRTSPIPLSQHTCLRVKNWIDVCVCNTLRGNVICSVPKALSGPLVKRFCILLKTSELLLPPMCWHGVSGKNSLSGNQSVIWGLYYFLNL